MTLGFRPTVTGDGDTALGWGACLVLGVSGFPSVMGERELEGMGADDTPNQKRGTKRGKGFHMHAERSISAWS